MASVQSSHTAAIAEARSLVADPSERSLASSSRSSSPTSAATSPASTVSFPDSALDDSPAFSPMSGTPALTTPLSTAPASATSSSIFNSSVKQRSGSAKPSSSSSSPRVRRKSRKVVKKGLSHYIHQRQLKFSTIIILSIYILNQIPFTHKYAAPFLSLSYVNPVRHTATIGPADTCFVIFWIVVLTFARSLVLDNFLTWCGRQVLNLKRPKTCTRFAEQAYALIQYSTFFTVGFVLYYRSPYWNSASALWQEWPEINVYQPLKTFYLIQLAVWFQQIYVINIEERRKDHWQMFVHHIITCALIIGSYQYYLIRVGHVIMVLMDSVDIFLSLAKVLRYVGYQRACDGCFIVFLLSWIVLRHGYYNYILYSACTNARNMITSQCYYDEAGELIQCFAGQVYWCLVALLGFLQLISIAWLYMIIRVLIRVLSGDAAADSRSDEEDEQGEVEQGEVYFEDHEVAHVDEKDK